MRPTIAALLVLALAGPAYAEVHVDIGIRFPAPPPLVVVPDVPVVQYAPSAGANVFFYGGQYWAFANGGWYASAGYNGPWIVVAPQIVPRPLLVVPVRYYHAPPAHWRTWQHREPPRWQREWGREWADRRGWKGRDRDDDRDHDRGRGRGRER